MKRSFFPLTWNGWFMGFCRTNYNRNHFYGIATLFSLCIFASCQQPAQGEAVQQQAAQADSNWIRLGPGGGGSTFIPTFSYNSADHFLVKCDMTGSYLTENGGASYQQINFANGASSYAYDPLDSNIVYAGSDFLNKSVDRGKSWTRLFPDKRDIKDTYFYGDHASLIVESNDTSSQNKRYSSINTIKVDPVQPGALYFSMGSQFYYTADHGDSWKMQKASSPIQYLYTNATSAKDVIYIFTPDSIFTFNKSTQQLQATPLPASMSPAFSFTAGTVKNTGNVQLYALHQDPKEIIDEEFGHTEVWSSDDLGKTWKQLQDTTITNIKSGIRPSYSMISCAEFDAAQVYLVCNRYKEKVGDKTVFWYGSLKTNDMGSGWNWVWKGGGGSGQYGVKDGISVANLNDAWVDKAFGGEYIRLIDVGVYPNDGNVAIVTDWYRTMKTIDGGKTWNQVYSIKKEGDTYASNGMDVTTAYGLHFDPFNPDHIAISYTDIGYHHSYDRGKSWSRSANGVPAEWVNTCYWLVFDPEVKDKVWSVWSNLHDFPRGKMTRNPRWKNNARGGVCVSTDGGKTWKPTSESMGFDSPTTSIVLDPKSKPGSRTLYASVYSKGIFKSTDDGKTWTLKNKGIGPNVSAFELTLAANGSLYVTISPTPVHKDGKVGRAIYSGEVYRSTDGAETWTKLHVADGLLFPNGIESDPTNPERLYLACWSGIQLSDLVGGAVANSTGGNENLNMPGGIFLSEDGGNTWKSIFDQKQYLYDVTVDAKHPGRLYANTFNKAAYKSEDYGKTWKKIKGYDFHWGHRVIPDPNDESKVYITTYGSSVWYGTPLVED